MGANLMGANLMGADLGGAKNVNALEAARRLVPPENGEFEAWKRCANGVIVRLKIPADAKRSSATTRKCRAECVDVLEVIGADVGVSIHDGVTKYRVGERVTCDRWEADRWVECGGGIHFHLTRIEAENHS
jgi:hypothetical protein